VQFGCKHYFYTMVNTKYIDEIIPEAEINGKHRNYINEDILNDDRIRRIITANLDKIKEFERSRGCKQNLPLNEYLNNKFSVWNAYNKHHKTKRYISASHILLYLAYLGYKIEYSVIKVD
jgi:hypothetical protein